MMETVDIDQDAGPGRDLVVPYSEGSLDVPQDHRDWGVKAHSFLDALCKVLQPSQVLPRNGRSEFELTH